MARRRPSNAHWRDSARSPRFFMIDAYAAFPLILFVMHIRWWTFFLCIGCILFLAILERFGFTITVFRRLARVYLAGNHRVARPWWI